MSAQTRRFAAARAAGARGRRGRSCGARALDARPCEPAQRRRAIYHAPRRAGERGKAELLPRRVLPLWRAGAAQRAAKRARRRSTAQARLRAARRGPARRARRAPAPESKLKAPARAASAARPRRQPRRTTPERGAGVSRPRKGGAARMDAASGRLRTSRAKGMAQLLSAVARATHTRVRSVSVRGRAASFVRRSDAAIACCIGAPLRCAARAKRRASRASLRAAPPPPPPPAPRRALRWRQCTARTACRRLLWPWRRCSCLRSARVTLSCACLRRPSTPPTSTRWRAATRRCRRCPPWAEARESAWLRR